MKSSLKSFASLAVSLSAVTIQVWGQSVSARKASAAVTPAAAGGGVSLQVDGLPADPKEMVWERLPLLRSDRVTVFRGVENVTGFNHHPTIGWHAGRFFAAWSSGARDENAPGHRILYAISENGRDWSMAAPLADSISNKSYTPGGFWVRNGEVHALASLRGGGNDYELYVYRWNAGNVAFEFHSKIAENFFAHDAPRLVPDGQWLMLGKNSGDTARVARGGTESLAAWKYGRLPSGPIAHDTFWRTLADGRIVAIEASGQPPARRLSAMFSEDHGASWSAPQLSNFPDGDSRLHGLKLSNGYHALVSNPNPSRYRIPLSIALSRDGLRHDWIANLRIEQTNKKFSGYAKAPGYQYARMLEHDGKLWTIYSVNKEDIEISVLALSEIDRLAKSAQIYPANDLGPEIVIDNRDERFASDHPWPASREAPGYHGSDYAYLAAGAPGWAKWNAVAPLAGTYRLYLRWVTLGTSQRSPMEDIAPIEIRHPGGIVRTTVDQTRYGGTWVCVGAYPLRHGETIEVKITGGGDGIIGADAIKVVRVAAGDDPPTL